jgi:hypothetical protein
MPGWGCVMKRGAGVNWKKKGVGVTNVWVCGQFVTMMSPSSAPQGVLKPSPTLGVQILDRIPLELARTSLQNW